eukprot:37550-Hanusia_phi.AAC.2
MESSCASQLELVQGRKTRRDENKLGSRRRSGRRSRRELEGVGRKSECFGLQMDMDEDGKEVRKKFEVCKEEQEDRRGRSLLFFIPNGREEERLEGKEDGEGEGTRGLEIDRG